MFFDGAITNALKGAAPFLDTIHDKVFLRRKYLTTQGIPKIPIFIYPNTIRCKVSGLSRHYATQGIWSRLICHKPRHSENGAPHSIITFLQRFVNRQIAQTFIPKFVQNTIVQNDESHTKVLKPTGEVGL